MKKSTCLWMAVLIGIVGCFTGCRQETVKQPVTVDGLSCRFEAQYSDMSLEGTLEIPEDGNASLTVTSPESMNGLCAQLQGDNILLTYGGLSYTLPSGNMPVTSFAQSLVEALRSLKNQTGGVATDQGVRYTGQCTAGDYEIFVDPDSGFPTQIQLPELGFSAKLYQNT